MHANPLAATAGRALQTANALAPQPSGLLERGNIDLSTRPRVKNRDGSVSTVRSMSVGIDGKEYLIPTVSEDGRVMSDDEAIQMFLKTGRHLGAFDAPERATDYANRLHQAQELQYLGHGQRSR